MRKEHDEDMFEDDLDAWYFDILYMLCFNICFYYYLRPQPVSVNLVDSISSSQMCMSLGAHSRCASTFAISPPQPLHARRAQF